MKRFLLAFLSLLSVCSQASASEMCEEISPQLKSAQATSPPSSLSSQLDINDEDDLLIFDEEDADDNEDFEDEDDNVRS